MVHSGRWARTTIGVLAERPLRSFSIHSSCWSPSLASPVESLESHRVRAVLTNRALLVGIRQDLENRVRSVLKTFGFVVGKGRGSFTDRVSEILAGKRLLLRLVRPLLKIQGSFSC